MALTGDYFYDTIVTLDPVELDPIVVGNLEVLVEILEDGVWDDAQVYSNENLSSVINAGGLPFTIPPSGEIAFWAGKGEYRITITDLQDPPRIAPRQIVWMSIPYADFDRLRFPGEIIMTARATPPDNWLVCNGAAVSRTQYAKLYNAIGIMYGPGDGGTTFNLPDLRGRFPIGVGTHIDIQQLGESDDQAVGNRSPTHTHGMSAHVHNLYHTHGGETAGIGDLGTTAVGTHTHAYDGGKQMHTRRNVPITGDGSGNALVFTDNGPNTRTFSLQSVYVAGLNAASNGGAYDQAFNMDPGGAHNHVASNPPQSLSTYGPSTPDTAAPNTPNTEATVSPHQSVNFLIRF